jgi:hypothetical protein
MGCAASPVVFRLTGGDAFFRQRCKAFITDSQLNFGTQNPITLGGEEEIASSPLWWTFGPQQNINIAVLYYFVCEFLGATGQWVPDFGVDHSYDHYSNGFLTTLVLDDNGADADFNDLTMEIAIMWLPITADEHYLA